VINSDLNLIYFLKVSRGQIDPVSHLTR